MKRKQKWEGILTVRKGKLGYLMKGDKKKKFYPIKQKDSSDFIRFMKNLSILGIKIPEDLKKIEIKTFLYKR